MCIGTPACNNGRFFCSNKGFMGKTIYSTWVNDGICDCCDGSDEYLNGHCNNTCKEEGKTYVERLRQEIQRNEIGMKIKDEYIKKAQNLKDDGNKKLVEIARQKEITKEELAKIIDLKNQLEANEKAAKEVYKKKLKEVKDKLEAQNQLEKSHEIFKLLDFEGKGMITGENIQINLSPKLNLEHSKLPNNESEEQIEYFKQCDWNTDNSVDKNDIQIIFDNIKQYEYDSNQFYEHISQPLFKCHPNIYEAFYIQLTKPTEQLNQITETPQHISDGQIPPPHSQTEGTAEIPPEEEFNENENQDFSDNNEALHKKADEEDEEDVEADDDNEDDDLYPRDRKHEIKPKQTKSGPETFEGEEPDILPYDEPTKNLLRERAKIQEEYDEMTRKQSDFDREYSNTQKMLETEYGPDSEYAILQGEHFEWRDEKGEYIYRLSPFDKVEQVSTSSDSSTNIGRWGKFESDETGDKYAFMLFTDGQQCWNGPTRRTKVRLFCGEENKLISVSEPTRCEYYLEFITPAKCVPLEHRHDLKPYLKHFRDEL